jgi:predicted DNA binding CopG/RHH family protein
MRNAKEKEREDVMVGIRMQPQLRERIMRQAEKAALPYTLYARMLLKRALDKIEQEEEATAA